MDTFISRSPADTEALGESWGRAAQAGWVIGLTGELGAGKTRLVCGLARGLGITARVHSPTFALVNIYPGGRLRLHHLDLYRLDSLEQILAAGLEEPLEGGGVAVVEWADKWFGLPGEPTPPAPFPGPHYRQVLIETVEPNVRRITYEDFGA